MEGPRRVSGSQISLAPFYQSTTNERLAQIKKEVAAVAPWLLQQLRDCQEVSLDAVIRLCPCAHEAMKQNPNVLRVVLGMINKRAYESNVGLPREGDILAYRRISQSGEGARLAGLLAGPSTEEGELPEDRGAAINRLIDDVANVWGIQLLPSQRVNGAKKGEVPRALPRPTSSDGELMALLLVGTLVYPPGLCGFAAS